MHGHLNVVKERQIIKNTFSNSQTTHIRSGFGFLTVASELSILQDIRTG